MGISTCCATGCAYTTVERKDHTSSFKAHIKQAQHDPKEAWYCLNDCRFKHFKENGTQTCSNKKPFFRLEDQLEHKETFNDFKAKKRLKFESRQIVKVALERN